MARARKVWSRMSYILSREGAVPRVYGLIFKAVVQAILLFGAETWVATSRMGKALRGFQTQGTMWMTGRLLRKTPDGR